MVIWIKALKVRRWFLAPVGLLAGRKVSLTSRRYGVSTSYIDWMAGKSPGVQIPGAVAEWNKSARFEEVETVKGVRNVEGGPK
jgi:hypothetical protein